VLHVISGPDHLAAVAPLALVNRGGAWSTGVRWGLGHASGVFLVGLLSLLLRDLLPVDRLSSWAERLVGLMLLGIGIWGLRKAISQNVHVHEHSHGGKRHVHIHVHGRSNSHALIAAANKPHVHTHAAFAVGTLHGLAGSSHFLGIIPALAFPTKAQAIGYFVAYGVGAIVAMGTFSSAVGWLAQASHFRGVAVYRTLMVSCSVVAMGVGIFWLCA